MEEHKDRTVLQWSRLLPIRIVKKTVIRTEKPPIRIAPGQTAKNARTLAIRSDNTNFYFY